MESIHVTSGDRVLASVIYACMQLDGQIASLRWWTADAGCPEPEWLALIRLGLRSVVDSDKLIGDDDIKRRAKGSVRQQMIVVTLLLVSYSYSCTCEDALME